MLHVIRVQFIHKEVYQTSKRLTRESHGFLHFLQSHGRGNSCSRVYSCPTVLFSHRLLPIIIAGNTFWQHKFSVNETEACFFATGKYRGATKRLAPCRVSMDVSLSSSAVFFEFVTIDSTSRCQIDTTYA